MAIPAFAKFSGLKLRPELADGLVVRRATLNGDYLYGKEVNVIISPAGLILDCDAIHCVWSGTEKFDSWFRDLYSPLIVMEPVG